MKIAFWKRRPTRKARYGSKAYFDARADLDLANRNEDFWASMLAKGLLYTPEECLQRIFEARRAEIDAMWRLGWDKMASEAQADLDMRLSWSEQ